MSMAVNVAMAMVDNNNSLISSRSMRIRAEHFTQPWLQDRSRELLESPRIHRKVWELSIITQTYLERVASHGHGHGHGQILGFGVGREPLASWFAARRAQVLISDKSIFTSIPGWTDTNQHATDARDCFRPGVCDLATYDHHVSFCTVDMTDIPDSFCCGEFDLTWSCGSLEHIGGLYAGMSFFLRQMSCLRPGGIAVHTTEFNPEKRLDTLESPDLSLYQERHFRELAERLSAQGDRLMPLDLDQGCSTADRLVSLPPDYPDPHLVLRVGDYLTTSVALIAQRGGIG